MTWRPISHCCCPGTDSSYFLLASWEQPPTWALWLLAHLSSLHPLCLGQRAHSGMQTESCLKSFSGSLPNQGMSQMSSGIYGLNVLIYLFPISVSIFWEFEIGILEWLKNSHLLKPKHLLPPLSGHAQWAMSRGRWGRTALAALSQLGEQENTGSHNGSFSR